MNTTSVSVTTRKANSRKKRQRSSNKQQQANRKRQRRQRRRNQAGIVNQLGRNVFRLSPCAKEYLAVLASPFNAKIESPCIPDLYDFPSKKITTKLRGTFTVGQEGFGFIVVANNQLAANDRAFVTYSTQAYTDTFLRMVDTTGGWNTVVLTNRVPYTSATINGSDMNWRVVGIGLRCRYTGTELNRGGTCCIARLANMSASELNSNQYGFATLMSDQTTSTFPVKRSWTTIAYTPRLSKQYSFVDDIGPDDRDSITPDLVFAVQGPIAGQTFDFEVISFLEYIGVNLDSVSKSQCDMPGLSAVRDVVSDQSVVPDASQSFYDKLSKTIEWIGSSETSGTVASTVAVGVAQKVLNRL